jgi:class 3 adenylate cyclase/NO-binding membrane sensor protein with MHYT domain
MSIPTVAANTLQATSAPQEYELPFEWSPGLIIISYLVAVAASYSTVTLLQLRLHPAMVVLAAFNLSVAGIWSMHFIGMEALHLSVKMSFEPGMTTFSALMAFVCASCGMALVQWRISNSASMRRSVSSEFGLDISLQAHIDAFLNAPHGVIVASGLFIAAGVCVMHYMGQMAIQCVARTEPRAGVIVASVLIAIAAATAALYLAFVFPLSRRFALPTAMVMGVAVCGMHYTAIYGFRYFVDPRSVEYMAAMTSEHQMSWTPYIVVASMLTSFATLSYTSIRYQAMIRSAMEHLEKYVPPPIVASVFDSQQLYRAENDVDDSATVKRENRAASAHVTSDPTNPSDTGSGNHDRTMRNSIPGASWGSHNDYRRAGRTRETDPYTSPSYLAAGRLAKFRGVNWLDLAMRPSRATVGFIDVVDFTTHAETMTQDMLMQEMAHFNQRCSTIIENSGGYVDKYLGDAIMAVWNGVVPLDDHAVRGVAACFSCVTPTGDAANCKFEAKAGLQSGQVFMGNVGSTSRLNFTVLGDTVNQASRIEGLTRHYAARLIIGQGTRRELGGDCGGFVLRFLDDALLKGKTRCVRVYEVLADAVEMDEAYVQSAELVAAAYELLHQHFREGDAATVIQHLTPGAIGAAGESSTVSPSRKKERTPFSLKAMDVDSVTDYAEADEGDETQTILPFAPVRWLPAADANMSEKGTPRPALTNMTTASSFVSQMEGSTKNRLTTFEVYLRERALLADGNDSNTSIAAVLGGDVPSHLLLARCHEALATHTAGDDKNVSREQTVMRFTGK